MSENETIGCIALMAMFVPVILLIIALVQVHKLKEAVRDLVERVAVLESRGLVAEPAPSVVEPKAAVPDIPPPVPKAAPVAPLQTVAPPPPPPKPAAPLPPPPPLIQPPPPPVPSKPFDWEAFFGVKLFAWIGGFVLFLGIVFLVKYSFENNLITP